MNTVGNFESTCFLSKPELKTKKCTFISVCKTFLQVYGAINGSNPLIGKI